VALKPLATQLVFPLGQRRSC